MSRIRSKLKNAFRAAYYFVRMLTRTNQIERGVCGAHFLDATEGDAVRRAFDRFASLETSRELLRALPDPGAKLQDHAALAQCPPGSLGRIYLDFMVGHGLNVDFIMEATALFCRMRAENAQRTWYRRHISVAHDLRHVVSGYDATPRGEVCNLCFAFGQNGHHGVAMLALFACTLAIARGDLGFLSACLEAFRRGRAATPIDFLPWELCLDAPLASCRAALGLRPPQRFAGHLSPDAYWSEPASGPVDAVQSLAAVLSPA